MNPKLATLIEEAVREIDSEEARYLIERVCVESIDAFVAAVNQRAETEMLKTKKLEGAHHRAIEAEYAALTAWRQTGQVPGKDE
jgi:hypothetical protein